MFELLGNISAIVFARLAGNYRTMNPIPSAKYGADAAASGGLIYVYGGRQGSVDLQDLRVLNPVTNTWSQLANGPSGKRVHTLHAIGDHLYLVGGVSGSTTAHNVIWRYHIPSNNWLDSKTLASGVYGHCAEVYGNEIYVFGGHNGTAYLKTVFKYNVDTREITALPDLPVFNSGGGSAIIGNRVYLFGGHDGVSHVNTLRYYDIDTSTHGTIATVNPPSPRRFIAMNPVGDRFYVMAGQLANSTVVNELWEYTPSTNTWLRLGNGGTIRHLPASVVLNDKLYSIAGHKDPDGTQIANVYEIT